MINTIRTSFSQNMIFDQCPRYWYYKYILKLPSVSDMCYAYAGSAIHNTLEQWYSGNITEIDKAKEHFLKEWKKSDLDNTKIKNKKDSYWLMILNGINLKIHLTSTEMKIFYPDVVGYLDGVDTENDRILDWKSSTRSKINEEEYTMQLKFYSYLYKRKFNRLPKKVVVYYLKYNGTRGILEFEPTEEHYKEAENWHINIQKRMLDVKAKKQVPPIGEHCNNWCPYENVCQSEQRGLLNFDLYLMGNYVHINGPIPALLNKGIEKKFSYELKNAHWIKQARPNANTVISFWNLRDRKLPIGFLQGLKKTLSDYAQYKKVPVNIIIHDKRKFVDDDVEMPDKFLNGIVLRDYQNEAVDVFLKNKIGILEIGTGGGKCFAKGTKILMYDLSVKNVEDIKVGDKLMGDNSTPRTVLSLANGKEEMFEIQQKLAMNYTVNKSHILSLKNTWTNYKEKIDIPLTKYLLLSENKKRPLKGYKNSIEFSDKPVKVDPYFLGLWLGDGGENSIGVSNKDEEVINYLRHYAKKLGMKLSDYNYNGHMGSYNISNGRIGGKPNILLNWMREYNLIGHKHIPFDYLRNTKDVRLQVLAGLIDSDGWANGKTKNGNMRSFTIVQKRKNLAKDILLLCNSLGYYCKFTKIDRFFKSINKNAIYYEVSVRGNLKEIPTKIKRKKFDNAYYPIRYEGNRINVVSKGIGNYYGFEIDGNKRFLLEDFTVVHNTEIAIEIIRRLKMRTLFIVDKIELLKQTKQRLEESLGIEVGQIGQGVEDIHQVTVATVQTITRNIGKYAAYLRTVRLCIFDETHKVAARSYFNISQQLINTEYRLGISGTAFRDDGNDLMITATTGYILYKLNSKKLIEDGWLIKPNIIFLKEYMSKEEIKAIEISLSTGLINETPNYANFYKGFISGNVRRNLLVNNIIEKHKGEKILILTKLIEHGQDIETLIPGSKHLYGGTSKKDREELFNEFVNGDLNILISTISIFAEGINIKNLSVVINLAANRGNVKTIQILGRILRILTGKKNAYYYDFIDETKFFRLASLARKRILFKEGHNVEVIKW